MIRENPRVSRSSEPKVSVVVVAFQHEAFIWMNLDSVAQQGSVVGEIIVVVPKSNDATLSEVERWFRLNPKTPGQVLSVPNRGPSFARNQGLAVVRHGFVAFLDGDDYWLDKKLEKQLELFKNPSFANLGIVYCGYLELFDQGGKPSKGSIVPAIRGHRCDRSLRRGNYVSGSASAVLIRAKCLGGSKSFDENLQYGEDWDLWRRLAKDWAVDFVPEDLVVLRRIPNSHGEASLKQSAMVSFFLKWSRPGEFSWKLYLEFIRRLYSIQLGDRQSFLFWPITVKFVGRADAAVRKLLEQFKRLRLRLSLRVR